jgi:hypothetical protein
MAQLALEVQNNAPQDRGPATSIPSTFSVALDTVSIPNNDKHTSLEGLKSSAGSASADIPWNRRLPEEATGITYTLKVLKVSSWHLARKKIVEICNEAACVRISNRKL